VKPGWEELAERLRLRVGELVDRRDISQLELADRTGYTQPHISNVLAGRRPLALSLAIALARATGTTISQLCDPDELRALKRWMREQCQEDPGAEQPRSARAAISTAMEGRHSWSGGAREHPDSATARQPAAQGENQT
jgi:transcriptional regulator with XRE-family HTH domain